MQIASLLPHSLWRGVSALLLHVGGAPQANRDKSVASRLALNFGLQLSEVSAYSVLGSFGLRKFPRALIHTGEEHKSSMT